MTPNTYHFAGRPPLHQMFGRIRANSSRSRANSCDHGVPAAADLAVSDPADVSHQAGVSLPEDGHAAEGAVPAAGVSLTEDGHAAEGAVPAAEEPTAAAATHQAEPPRPASVCASRVRMPESDGDDSPQKKRKPSWSDEAGASAQDEGRAADGEGAPSGDSDDEVAALRQRLRDAEKRAEGQEAEMTRLQEVERRYDKAIERSVLFGRTMEQLERKSLVDEQTVRELRSRAKESDAEQVTLQRRVQEQDQQLQQLRRQLAQLQAQLDAPTHAQATAASRRRQVSPATSLTSSHGSLPPHGSLPGPEKRELVGPRKVR